jgi:DNA topoisomerase-1
VIREVADAIGDTPAVCRSSYVDPGVLDRFDEGETVARALRDAARRTPRRPKANGTTRETVERSVLRLLTSE